MDLITIFNDSLIDYIAVYPNGKAPVLNPWLRYFTIEQIRIMFIDIFDQDLIVYLYNIEPSKIQELFSIIFAKPNGVYLPPHKRILF